MGKLYSPRFGTLATRLGGMGDAYAAADAEDAEMGAWWGGVNGPATTNAYYAPASGPSTFDTLINALPGMLEKGIALKQSLDVSALNRELIRRGMAPLSQSQIAALQPGVRFGLSPDTQNLVIYGGIALLAVFAFSALTKRR